MARTKREARRSGYTWFASLFDEIVTNVENVIEGKSDVIRLALIALVAEGHILIEDVPGVGKTMLAKAIARSTSCMFRRIQFTPDLLPSDITGVNIYSTQGKRFEFKPGAIFGNIILGDEINRASPKTQSALLESMEERQVTVDGVTHKLSLPFMVIATQNPIEHEGTYPLPESQLDRFMMRLQIGYPDSAHSVEILNRHGITEPVEDMGPVVDTAGVLQLIEAARRVHVADGLKRYIVDLTDSTRVHPGIFLGASPRAALFLLKSARAKAASEARDFVLPDDIKDLTVPVLSHRVLLSADAQMRGTSTEEILTEVLAKIPIPGK